MNPQGNQGFAPQQPGGASYPPLNTQLQHQTYQQAPGPGVPQGYGPPNTPGGGMQQAQMQHSYPSAVAAQQQQQQQQPQTPNMAPPPSGSRPAQQSNGGQGQPGTPVRLGDPEQFQKVHEGKKYVLEVVQEPVRARMCGFGDKDRRPITPPPCVRLRIIDIETGNDCPTEEFDTNFFILTVDLWDETGHKEVNLVRHSATSPSISAATSSSYPPPSNPVFPYTTNTAAAVSAHTQAASQASAGMQVHVGLTGPGYGPHGYNAHHAAPYMAQPPPQTPPQAQGPANMPGSRPQDAQSYYVSSTGQPTGTAGYGGYPQQGGGMPSYPQQPMSNMLSPAHTAPMDPRSAPSGMFTRNLIGSLAVNANPLTDTTGKLGIWFILQDLSVRTEGTFRLKMQFCSVADPVQKNVLVRGTAPILASTFSAPFHVFSAKKFPGVIESTPLSKCFAMQGVKIPIRKDGPTGKAADLDDDAADGQNS